MNLDTPAKSVEVDLAGAVTTNELPWTVHYDQYDSTFALDAIAESDGVTTGATAVTICAAPAAGKVRHVRLITVYNKDTVAAVVTIQINSGSVREVLKETLQPGESLVYAS